MNNIIILCIIIFCIIIYINLRFILISNKKLYSCKCSDLSQVNLHKCNALVLQCMDFRLRDNIVCQLNLKKYKNNYDEFIMAGSSLGYENEDWKNIFRDHIKLSYKLHDINEIIIIDHMKCGAYKLKYGNLTDIEEEKYHIEHITNNINIIWNEFNPINGTILKIPNLKLYGYLSSIDGGTFELINYK
jgi:hypothetical protein